VLAGSAATLFHAFAAGCDGAILALASLVPEGIIEMRELVDRGKLKEARQIQRRLMPLARSVGGQYGVPGLKAALNLTGFAAGPPRPPLLPVSSEVIALLRTQLEALGLVHAATGVRG
jgi:4-hydroxy-2-oxoglutarate aldolase